MTNFLQLDKIKRTLLRTTLYPVVALCIVTTGNASASSPAAQSNPAAPAAGEAVDCVRLPTKEEFLKKDYDKETIRNIQKCLKQKGFFNAPAHGVKGPLTIAALEKYQAKKAACVPGPGPVKVDCKKLPSKDQFIKHEYDADAIRIIQGCLSAKGYYKGAIDGKKGQAVIDALAESQAADRGLKKGAGRDECANLPSQKAFVEGRYDKKSIVIIQGCLWEKGYYTGPIDGLKGHLTIAALGRLSRGESEPAPEIKEGGTFVTFSLTGNDFEDLKGANAILDSIKELNGEEYENNNELKEAVQSAIKEVTDPYDASMSTVLKYVGQMKASKLTEEDFKAFKEADVPDTIIGTLRELQDQQFSDKSLLVRGVEVRLNEMRDPYQFLQTEIQKDVNDLAANSLTDRFFKNIEAKRIPETVLKKLKQIQDVEYPNAALFVNALETDILNPMKNNKEIDQGSFDIYKSLLLAKAAKAHLFEKTEKIQWSGWPHGCYLDDFTGVVYGFYPFWNSGTSQKIDFSMLTRIGYFALTFNGNGEIAERFDWQPERAAFIGKARQYMTKVDLVIYRSNWQNWSKFIAAKKTSFIEKLTNSIVDAVTEKVTDTAMQKVESIISFGTKSLPSLGDGVTLFFDGYPDDAQSDEFFRELIQKLRTKLKTSGKRLSIVLPLKSLAKTVELHSYVDLILILMEEPTKDTKKSLRQEVEKLFTGAERRSVLRKIVPIISPVGHDYDKGTDQQLKDDLIYFEDNFGGVGFWPLPTSKDNGVAELNNLVRANFSDKGNSDYFQNTLKQNAPWFGRIIGPHRWAFRIAFDILLFVLLTYALLSSWIFELREFFQKHFWWFLGMGALALLIQICLCLWDPFWRGRTTGILALLLFAGVFVLIWGYVRRMKRNDLP